MNDTVTRFWLELVQVISINIHNIVPTKVGRNRLFELGSSDHRASLLVISGDGRMDNINVQSDQEPLRVVRQSDQNVHYKQQVNVRFLEPPPGPEPAPIIIKVRRLSSWNQLNACSSVFRSDKHQLRLRNPPWSFDNVHQHPRRHPHSSSVGVSR
jgi:hypothetical protein